VVGTSCTHEGVLATGIGIVPVFVPVFNLGYDLTNSGIVQVGGTSTPEPEPLVADVDDAVKHE